MSWPRNQHGSIPPVCTSSSTSVRNEASELGSTSQESPPRVRNSGSSSSSPRSSHELVTCPCGMSELTPSENYCEVWLRYVARARTDQTGRDVRLGQRLLDWSRYTTRAQIAGLAEIHNSGKDYWTG
ncbi:hypothetical protein B296_00027870 [Ensete ventricosum]|uniref:Uncharacterized protein n=1 Tax=Ensete ventricosum TaxID=4639 RepID=A0A426YFP2_ENSVE|nr:hypothetical protein B296_00027870 [Ensete ventricosum]